jgi:hypothetical protein
MLIPLAAPAYEVDLALPEGERWAGVIAREAGTAQRLLKDAMKEMERVPESVRRTFARLYKIAGGLYAGEMQAWATAMKVTIGTATMVNCAYELSYLDPHRILGCTAGVRWIEGLGMTHVRNLDWPMPAMGNATRRFDFHKGNRRFTAVGVPAQVGILSGMVPGAFSATINWAPSKALLPSFTKLGPTFLLRQALETCDSYSDAVRFLSTQPLSINTFFTVCGVEPGEGCVIERAKTDAQIRPLSKAGVVVQANHYVHEKFAKANAAILTARPGEELFTIIGSCNRHFRLEQALTQLTAAQSLADAGKSLDTADVLNDMTCQQLVFCPKSGDVAVWRRA